MGRKCSVKGCRTAYRGHPIQYGVFRFPTHDLELREQWAKQIGKTLNDLKKNMGVCARHFPSNAKVGRKFGKCVPLEPPSLFLNTSNDDCKEKISKDKKKKARYSQKKKTTIVNDFKKETTNAFNSQYDFDTQSEQFKVDNLYPEVVRIAKNEELPAISLQNKLDDETTNADVVRQSLMKAVYDIFMQHFCFNSELYIGGQITFDFDQGKKIEFDLNKKFSNNAEDLTLNRNNHVLNNDNPVITEDYSQIGKQDSHKHSCERNILKQEQEQMTKQDKPNTAEPLTLFSVLEQRTKETLHYCQECNLYFTNIGLFYEHRNKFHPRPKVYYTCSMCNSKFDKKKTLAKHLQLHEFEIHCNICGGKFGNLTSYGIHVKHNHTGYKPYVCMICNEAFSQLSQLKKHEKKHSTEKLFKCDQCFKEYRNSADLKFHAILIHNKPIICNFHICKICGWKSYKKTAYNEHMMKRHNYLKPFQCQDCEKTFCSRWELKAHTKASHSEERLFVCEFCGSMHKTLKSLQHHMKNEHFGNDATVRSGARQLKPEHSYTCLICNKKYVHPYLFEKHIFSHLHVQKSSSHSETNAETCSICFLKFDQPSQLKKHIRIKHERGVKPFECNICFKRFSLKSYLSTHKKRHLGLKPHVCNICDMRFLKNSILQIHMRRHTGERHFTCDSCGKQYTEKRGLLKHKRSVHDNNNNNKNDIPDNNLYG